MSVFYVLHRKVADIITIFSLIKAFWKLDLHILYKADKTVEWLWGEILMLNTIYILKRWLIQKKKSCHYICCIQTSNNGYRIVWVQCILDWASKADTNEAVITLVHRLMVENVPESCVALMATSKPCSKCCSWKIEWKKIGRKKKIPYLNV